MWMVVHDPKHRALATCGLNYPPKRASVGVAEGFCQLEHKIYGGLGIQYLRGEPLTEEKQLSSSIIGLCLNFIKAGLLHC